MLQIFSTSEFYKRWTKTLSIMFSPGFFLSAVVTCVALYFSVRYKVNIPFSNTMAILGSIFGGIGGAFFKDEYDKLSGKNILEKKGRSALRNLQGTSTQLNNIRAWVLEFRKNTRRKEDKRTLEEINRHIATVELNIASGVEDWVDIVPELKESTQKEAELDKKYKDLLQSFFNELVEKRRELVASTDRKDQKKVGELKGKISDLEQQIKEVRKERPHIISTGLSLSGPGGPMFATNSNGSLAVSMFGPNKCQSCGKTFMQSYSSIGNIGISDSIYCPDCRGNSASEAIRP